MKFRNFSFALLLCTIPISCNPKSESERKKPGQEISTAQLEELILSSQDKVRVLHYWATWCRPCMEELQDFDTLQSQYPADRVEVIVVNVDRTDDQVEQALIDFHYSQFKNIKHAYISISDTEQIMTVADSEWVEVIPVTYIISNASEKSEKFIGASSFADMNRYIDSL